MIRLRRTLERGRQHPVLGPIVLILLALLLAMVLVHGTQDDAGAVVEVGFACFSILVVFGPIVARVTRPGPRLSTVPVTRYRGPPTRYGSAEADPSGRRPDWRVSPLRR